jgi:hypothetical protein
MRDAIRLGWYLLNRRHAGTAYVEPRRDQLKRLMEQDALQSTFLPENQESVSLAGSELGSKRVTRMQKPTQSSYGEFSRTRLADHLPFTSENLHCSGFT